MGDGVKNDNELILERLRGVGPLKPCTLQGRFDPRNPNRQEANDNQTSQDHDGFSRSSHYS